jgi:hypothetical protein
MGHFVQDCPHAYDIRFMDMEEIKSLVDQLPSDRGIEPTMEEVEDAKKEEVEDVKKEEREAEEGNFGRSSE